MWRLKLADYVVTEGGFASDLGFQKFCDIVCRSGGFRPSAAVLVTTVRATKSHGGMPFADLGTEHLDALRRGIDNLAAHVDIVRQYGLPCVVSINDFPTDTEAEVGLIRELAVQAGAETVVVNRGFAQGGEGAVDLARAVVEACAKPSTFEFLTPAGTDIERQIEVIATRVYGAEGVDYLPQAVKDIARMRRARLRRAPGVHGEDPPLAQPRPLGAEPADRLPSPGARRGAERGAGFVVASAATCSACPATAGRPRSTGSTSTSTAARWACSRGDDRLEGAMASRPAPSGSERPERWGTRRSCT